MSRNNLLLHEEILLLALHDEKGTVGSEYLGHALGGAVLAELLLSGRVRVVQQRRKKFIEVESRRPLGDPVVDECLDRIADARRRATAQTWVGRFAGIKQLKHRVARELCRRGILRSEEDKVLLIFTRKVYPEIDPVPERELIERLRQAIFTDTDDVDPRTVVLASLANASNLLKYSFDRKELKRRKRRLEQLVNGEIAGKATKDAIEAMQAAILAAVIVPTIVTTTVSS